MLHRLLVLVPGLVLASALPLQSQREIKHRQNWLKGTKFWTMPSPRNIFSLFFYAQNTAFTISILHDCYAEWRNCVCIGIWMSEKHSASNYSKFKCRIILLKPIQNPIASAQGKVWLTGIITSKTKLQTKLQSYQTWFSDDSKTLIPLTSVEACWLTTRAEILGLLELRKDNVNMFINTVIPRYMAHKTAMQI